jgi:hypothetical protein
MAELMELPQPASVGNYWLRDAVAYFRSQFPQQTLSGKPKVCNDAILHNAVMSALSTAKLQEEKDNQNGVRYVALFVAKHETGKLLDFESVRRCIQKMQNEWLIAPVSDKERERRKKLAEEYFPQKYGKGR